VSVQIFLNRLVVSWSKLWILCFVDRAPWYSNVTKPNLMHNLFLVYFVNLYMFRANLYPTRPTDSQLKSTTRTSCCVYIQYTSWWWATNMPETC